MEVAVVRLLLDLKNSTKYNGKEIVIKKEFYLLDNLLKTADAVGLKLSLSSETIRRLYEWGNVVVHSAYRMPHEEMWQALFLASVIGAEKKELKSRTDQLLDRLCTDGIIEIS